MNIDVTVNPHFESFMFDWDYEKYLLVGGYGSSKSYHVALKIVLKCLEEKRKVLVIREVYETIRESCYDLFCEILEKMDLLDDEGAGLRKKRRKKKKVVARVSPLMIKFPNGSKIIFKGMDKPAKLKSINDVSIIWLEECSEIKYDGYKELLGRARHPYLSIHFILSTNPVDEQNWVYRHFFVNESEDRLVLDPERLYKKRIIVKKGVYYHHSVIDDNMFAQRSYVRTLDEIREYDQDLWRVARQGRFGTNGLKVLPQFRVAEHEEVMEQVKKIEGKFKFTGMDFGFEVSYNAVVRMAVDDENKVLYVWWEYYKNQQTDPETARDLSMLKDVMIAADCAEPKAIRYFRQMGFRMRPCKKSSRLEQVKKMKRFREIVVSKRCRNTIRELKDLVYAKDKQGNIIYDEFNIDPHTFSAMWYGLDNYEVADLKERKRNNMKGSA